MFNITKITDGESLYILREREGICQEKAARLEGVNRADYGRWERDQDEYPGSRATIVAADLSDNEGCIIMRRREGVRQGAVAADLGLCRYMIVMMESGEKDCARLVEYWSA